ncbi:MAG: PhoX family phosphatase [bacterium]
MSHESNARPSPDVARAETFADLLARRFERRRVLRAVAAAPLFLALPTAGCRRVPDPNIRVPSTSLRFEPVSASSQDAVRVPAHYRWNVVARWGDPVLPGAPPWDFHAQTANAQSRQFGYNNDFVAYFPLSEAPDERGLLAVNHEYTSAEHMFPGLGKARPSREQIDVEMAAHGMSIVEIERGEDGGFRLAEPGRWNRRITAETQLLLSGPAAGSEWLRTSRDPSGRRVAGMLYNCSGGKTPWDTVLTCEENFHNYFGGAESLPADDPRAVDHARYGIEPGLSDYGWESAHPRFDVGREPNEAFRFGWVVEVDPFEPNAMPRKRTALGRFKHEAASVTLAGDGRVVVYSGDDERFEYVYKFVSRDSWNPHDRAANRDLLDHGTLYVARFDADGSGRWLPLEFGREGLTTADGFRDQADVLVRTRSAADALGATRMDRPEDIEISPIDGRVYVALTNNTKRDADDTDAANPRGPNRDGHVLELEESGDDAAAESFRWDVLILCGDPSQPDSGTYFAGWDPEECPAISCPDNLLFDADGCLWIATDGQPGTVGVNDGLYAIPVRGEDRGHLRRFATLPAGAECCGPELTPAGDALFLAVQHPGEKGSLEKPQSTWPDGTNPPRPAVICVVREDGGRIGT